MSIDHLSSILSSLQGTHVTELEYQGDNYRFRITRDPTSGTLVSESGDDATTPDSLRSQTPEAPAHEIIRANMAGTFYRANATDQPPFVEIGDEIKEGQQVAVLEAMKMFHALETEVDGRVIEILVENDSPVEIGMPLMVIEPSGATHV